MEPTVITDLWATLILNWFKVLAIFFWNSLKIWQSDKTSTGLRLVCRNSATCVIQCCYSIYCSSDSWSDSFTTDVELSSWWQQGNGSFVACYLKQWTLNDWMGLHDPNICLSCTVYMYSTETWLAQQGSLLFCSKGTFKFHQAFALCDIERQTEKAVLQVKKSWVIAFYANMTTLALPVQNFYQDLVEIDEISLRMQRSRWDLAMMFVGF